MPKDDGMGEKTESATPKRREEAREKGQVAKSQDLTGALTMLIGFSVLKILGGYFGERILALFRQPFTLMHDFPSEKFQDILAFGGQSSQNFLYLILPFLSLLFLLALAIPAMQVGLKFAPKAFELDPNKLNPIKGIGKIFSIRSLMKLVTGIGKISIVGVVLFIFLSSELPAVMKFIRLFDYKSNNSGVLVVYLVDMILWLGIYAGATLTVLGLIDYFYQRWQHEEDLKMSKYEVKEEMKNMDGDPHMKRRRAERARQIAQGRMIDSVPDADVVVTNPTHYSVALRYKESDPGPRLLAKGVDHLALQIREKASENGVPIVEKPELARALYRWVEIDELIPDKFWGPVAEVLAYVYEIDKERRERALG